jgi:hypothetical protein
MHRIQPERNYMDRWSSRKNNCLRHGVARNPPRIQSLWQWISDLKSQAFFYENQPGNFKYYKDIFNWIFYGNMYFVAPLD